MPTSETTPVLLAGLLWICAAACYLLRDRSQAPFWWTLGWAVLVSSHLILAERVTPLSTGTTLLVLLATVAFDFGALAQGPPPAPGPAAPMRDPDRLRLTVAAAILTSVYGVGYLAFRATITQAAQTPFEQLTREQVRYYQVYEATSSGWEALAFSIGPVVACVGVLGGLRHSRAWYLLTALVLVLAYDSPSRTDMLSTAVTALAFYLLCRRRYAAGSMPRSGRPGAAAQLRILLGAATAVAAAVWYFGVDGNRGSLSDAASADLFKFVPPSLNSIMVYLLGGLSALSQALDQGLDPRTEAGSSVYVLVRAWSLIFRSTAEPDPVSQYVYIPTPLNVYTGIGDVVFDLGPAGVLIVFFAIGLCTSWLSRRSRSGGAEWLFTFAFACSVLGSTPITLRWFYLNSATTAALGFVVITLITAPSIADSVEPESTAPPTPLLSSQGAT